MIDSYFKSGDLKQPFVAIPTRQDLIEPRRLSQIRDLIIRPFGAPVPTNWTNPDAVEAIVDNTVSDNSAAKWLIGSSGIPDPAEITVNYGKNRTRIGRRLYTLEYSPTKQCDGNVTLMDQLQTGRLNFTFWMRTRGGVGLGGPTGIAPSFVNVRRPFDGGVNGIERATIIIQWFGFKDPDRAEWPTFFETTANPVPKILGVSGTDQAFGYEDSGTGVAFKGS